MATLQNNNWSNPLFENAGLVDHTDLYRAQDAGIKAIQTNYFPCYSEAFAQSKEGLGGYAIWSYSRTYTAISFVGGHFFNIVQGTLYVTHCLALGIFKVEDFLLGWATRPLARVSYNYVFRHIVSVYSAVFPLNEINGRRRFVSMPLCVEKFIGDNILYPYAISGMVRTFQKHSPNETRLEDSVNAVLAKLKDANRDLMQCPTDGSGFNYRMITCRSETINAFAVPGGGMVVYSGILKELEASMGQIKKSEIELADGSKVEINLKDVTLEHVMAALIGHEVTHVASRHSVTMIFIKLVLLFISSIVEYIPIGSSKYLERVEKILDSFYSRRNEYEADITGAYFAKNAGCNPLGAIYLQEFFKQIKEVGYTNTYHKHLEFTYSHPCSENRQRALLAAIKQFSPESLEGKVTRVYTSDRYNHEYSSSAVAFGHRFSKEFDYQERPERKIAVV